MQAAISAADFYYIAGFVLVLLPYSLPPSIPLSLSLSLSPLRRCGASWFGEDKVLQLDSDVRHFSVS